MLTNSSGGNVKKSIIAIIIVSLMTACTSSPQQSAEEANAEMVADNLELAADSMEAEADAALNGKPKPNPSSDGQWAYDESKDEMRGATRKTATLSASNSLQLGAPYGETTPALNIRKDPKFGFDIFITSEGQPLCRSYNDDTVSTKFDNGPVREWSCAEASDGSPGVVFFNREQSFLAALKKSKKLIVEINYFNAGKQQISFPVEGLQW